MIIKLTVIIAALMLPAMTVLADATYEFGVSGGYTNNLLSEAGSLDDSYSTYSGIIHFYPASSVCLDATGEYTYYSKTYDLSNIRGALNLSWIPTAPEGNTSIYIEAGLDTRRYRDRLEEFDNNNATIRGALAYQVSDRLELRTGFSGRLVAYPDADSTTDADHNQVEIFAGLNVTLPLQNTLDIESGYGRTGYSFINSAVDSVLGLRSPDDLLADGDFSSFYVSPRLSRSIGTKTGVSLTYTYRQFYDIDNAVVLGYTTDFLSPWASFFEGSAVTLRMKSYALPHMQVTAGIGFWDKTYLRTLEIVSRELYPGYPREGYDDPKNAEARDDETASVYLGIMRPFMFGESVVEPSLSIEYTDNQSSQDAYDYSTTSISLGLNVRP